MLWLAYAIGLAMLYMNIGYVIMNLSYRVARKNSSYNESVKKFYFNISWKTFFLFPGTTLFNLRKIDDFTKGTCASITEHNASPAIGATIGEDKKLYVYGTPFIWPVKIVWIPVSIVCAILYVLILNLRSLGEHGWHTLTQPSKFIMKGLDE